MFTCISYLLHWRVGCLPALVSPAGAGGLFTCSRISCTGGWAVYLHLLSPTGAGGLFTCISYPLQGRVGCLPASHISCRFFTTRATREDTNYHTTQQCHCGTYTLRKAEFRKTQVPRCSVQHSYNSRTEKQPRCPSTDECIERLWYTYAVEHYSAIKKESV